MPWPVRCKVVGLLFLSTIINYADRVNISVAASDIMRETGWDKAQFGVALSAFLLGYALFQFPGGLIADRWSPRKVLALSCFGFSLFTALTPLGQASFALLLVLRFLVGACESIGLPALAVFNSHWVPRQEFGRAQTVSISGTSIGQMLAYPTTTWLIQMLSWPVVFYFNAAVGFLWAAAWLLYTTDTPREHRKVTPAELRHIESYAVHHALHGRPSFWSIFATPSATLSIALFVAFYFTFSLAVSGYWSMPLELAPRAVGAVGGVMNTSGNFAGVFGPTIAGLIITYTGSWVTLFYLAAGCGVLSCLVFTLLVNTDPIEIKGLETSDDEEKVEAQMGIGH
jgi:sugar phosphate permease